jgi:hypothetical protein
MPVRIKPELDLGPCVLTLDCITKIVEQISANYPGYELRAVDGIWEIYDEPKEQFIAAISARRTLDVFTIVGEIYFSDTPLPERVELIFDETQATFRLSAIPEKIRTFEHLKSDIMALLRPPSFAQKLAHLYRSSASLPIASLSVAALAFSTDAFLPNRSVPYSRIIITETRPSAFTENIKANLVSSAIWFVIGIGAVLIGQWIFHQFGIDLAFWEN